MSDEAFLNLPISLNDAIPHRKDTTLGEVLQVWHSDYQTDPAAVAQVLRHLRRVMREKEANTCVTCNDCGFRHDYVVDPVGPDRPCPVCELGRREAEVAELRAYRKRARKAYRQLQQAHEGTQLSLWKYMGLHKNAQEALRRTVESDCKMRHELDGIQKRIAKVREKVSADHSHPMWADGMIQACNIIEGKSN